ncbi:hypothetical protein HPB47_019629, partial [Ixodes persulcatus]
MATSEYHSKRHQADVPQKGGRSLSPWTIAPRRLRLTTQAWQRLWRQAMLRASPSKKTNPNETTGALTRQPRLPPLPRDDFKIIIRPRGALNLANLETIHLSRAIAEKPQQHTRDRPNSTTFQHPSEDLARHIRGISTLHYGDIEYEVTADIAAPDDSARGVVRGIPPGTTGQELIDNLYSPGYEILSARMIGKTSTALITFTGKQLPKYVIFEHAALPCSWYLPTRHACYICHEIGHRTDVCPNPDTAKCVTCGVSNPTKGLECTPRCALCTGVHPTGSKECPKKLAHRPPTSVSNRRRRQKDTPALEGHKEQDRGNGLPRDQAALRQPPDNNTVSWAARLFPQNNQKKQTTPSSSCAPDVIPATKPQPGKKTPSPVSASDEVAVIPEPTAPTPSQIETGLGETLENFAYLLAATFKLAKQNGVVVLGDLNAAHPAWGYGKATVKGNKLWELIHQQGLTVHTDPACPTRIGNSVSRDTCPDLTMTKRLADAEWCNTEETLGSDHCILITTVPLIRKNSYIKKTRLVNWDEFRKQRETTSTSEITSFDEWVSALQHDVSAYAKYIMLTDERQAVDPHLLHLWEARRSLIKRWRRQKHNRTVKIRIARLTEEAAHYAVDLMQQNWQQFCNSLQGTLGTAKTWSLLRHLLYPTKSKSATRHIITKLLHQYPGTNKDILDALRDKYIGQQHPPSQPMEYRGAPNADLDNPIPLAEVNQASLTNFFNQHWEEGTLPAAWKHADIILIPKSRRTTQIGEPEAHLSHFMYREAIRARDTQPGSNHTSRTTSYHRQSSAFVRTSVRKTSSFNYTRISINKSSAHSTRTILTLDLKGAFDNLSHDIILTNLSDLNCVQRTFAYIQAFLQNRTATIGIGDLRTQPLPTPNRGTSQGSVLSPMLFNVAMMKLPAQLVEIEGVYHAFYADDITIWATSGSDGEIQDALQRATDVVQRYARGGGLQCAPEKSQLLIVKNKCRNIPYDSPQLTLTLENQVIPQVTCIRILGLFLQQDGGGSHALQRLTHTTIQILRMMGRIANRRYGLKEEDATRLIQALIISRVTYSVPYLTLKPREREKLEVLIRRSYKQALGLPLGTSTPRLLSLGIHNTVEEHNEAHLIGQRERLKLTPAGRQVLTRLGYSIQTLGHSETIPFTAVYRTKISVAPIPKNMHPEFHQGRRQARARALQKKLQYTHHVRYTDAASYPGRLAMAVSVIDENMREVTTATVPTSLPLEEEEASIALAITSTPAITSLSIITDSQAACRSFGNARALTFRAPPPQEDPSLVPIPIPLTYRDILQHLRLSRRTLPPPHKSLTRDDA